MDSVTSSDGTRVAMDILGDGPPVVLVTGAFGYRKYPKSVDIAERLSRHFTVFNYDRRGRGDSGDTPPYAVGREIEDLAAVVRAAGGSAATWGMSSGGVLALRAAAAGVSISQLAVYQPPFLVTTSQAVPPPDFAERLNELVATDQQSKAVHYFMTEGMGAPAFVILMMRLLPVWPRLTALAHTLPYDCAVVGKDGTGGPLDPADWAAVASPALVMDGQKSPARAKAAAEALTRVLPNARHVRLPGQGIDVSPKVLVPELISYFTSAGSASPGSPDPTEVE